MASVLGEKKKWLYDFHIGRATNKGKDCERAPESHEQYQESE